MANGDAAAAAGLATFAPTQDIRMGYDNDNIRGDELAQHLTNGTHPAGAITSGTFSADRIPGLDASKTVSGVFFDGRIPTLDYRKITVDGGPNIIDWTNGAYVAKLNGSHNGQLTLNNAGSSCLTANGQIFTSAEFRTTGTVWADGQIRGDSAVRFASTYNQTNTGRAVYIASDGLLGVGSSSKRYKKNIEDANLDTEAILSIAIRQFNYKKTFDQDDTTTHLGVIAEELIELGLDEFVFYDAQGNADGVAYDKLALAALAVIQKQQTKLDAIEARLDALEGN